MQNIDYSKFSEEDLKELENVMTLKDPAKIFHMGYLFGYKYGFIEGVSIKKQGEY